MINEQVKTSEKSLKQCIRDAENQLAWSDIYTILSFATGKSKEFIVTHPEYVLSPRHYSRWKEYLNRRKRGEPVAYITGKKEFYSLSFAVNRNTLIPRPETEILVEEVIKLYPGKFLDIGTGCGNIAITVKFYLPGCEVVATDISPGALKIAEKNAVRILGGKKIHFMISDFFENIPDMRFDVIASNPPYIKRSQLQWLQKEVRNFEPPLALDGGEDGICPVKAIITGAKKYLMPEGRLVLETDPALVREIKKISSKYGFIVERVVKDLAALDRVLVVKSIYRT